MARKARIITNEEEIKYIANLSEKDITAELMNTFFGTFDEKRKYNPYDIITIPKDSYGIENNKNKESFTTTIGIYIFNKFFIEKDLFDIYHYINKIINKKMFKKLSANLAYKTLEKKITTEQYSRFLMKTQFLTQFVSILSAGSTEKMLLSSKVINKEKKRLYNEKYKKKFEENPKNKEIIAFEMEKELLNYARNYLKDDPSMDIFDSGANCDFNNHYKNMFVMRGAVTNPDPEGEYGMIFSNYMDGIKAEEYPELANSLAEGPYNRAKKTEFGGYLEKQFLSAFQHLVLDPAGSDCHTDKYLTVDLTENNANDYMYNYIIEGKNLIELTSENIDKYIGKKVKMRFSIFCKSKTGFCNKCMGNFFYRLRIQNIGACTPKIPSVIKMLSMKSFHASNVDIVELNPMKAFSCEQN